MSTVGSVLASDYHNIEVIIVDDASTDETFDIISGITDPRVSVFKNDNNLGMAKNWNRCLSLCRGEYIRLLCADDLIDPDLISTEVAILDSVPSVVMVSSDTAFINEAGEVVGHYDRYHIRGNPLNFLVKFATAGYGSSEKYDPFRQVPGKKILKHSLFSRDYLGAPLANLFRRSAAEAVGGFDDGFSYIIDYDFFAAIAFLGDVYIIPEKKNSFRLRRGSNTSEVLGGKGTDAYLSEHKKLVKKYAPRLGLGPVSQAMSVFIRRLTIVLGAIYLKVKRG